MVIKKNWLLLSTFICCIVFIGCKKYPSEIAVLKTGIVSDIAITTATVTGEVISVGTTSISEHGHCWSSVNDVPDVVINQGKTALGAGAVGNFTSSLTTLYPNTLYYVRAYAILGADTIYGNTDIKSFNTKSAVVLLPPNVATAASTGITTTSFAIGGNIVNVGGSAVTAYGHCISTINKTPTIADTKTNLGGTATALNYSSDFRNLAIGAIYYVRAYATNAQGTSYGITVNVQTQIAQVPPSVFSGPDSAINATSTLQTGSINAIGSGNVSAYGHVYSATNAVPDISDLKTNLGTATAPTNFLSNITGLQSLTKYYVRAYATNAAGTGYGYPRPVITDLLNQATALTEPASSFGNRKGLAAAAVGTDLYVGIGVDNTSGNTVNTWYKYNTLTAQWSSAASIPGYGLGFANCVAINGKIYITGGASIINGTAFTNTTTFVYDPVTNGWTNNGTNPLSERYGGAAFVLDNIAYYTCGANVSSGALLQTTSAFNAATNTWSSKANFPGGVRVGACSFDIQSYGYVGLGNTSTTYYTDLYQYYPTQDVWVQRASLPGSIPSRSGSASFSLIDNKGYVCFGYSATADFNNIIRYIPASNSWEALPTISYNNYKAAFGMGVGFGNFAIMGRGILGSTGGSTGGGFNPNQFIKFN